MQGSLEDYVHIQTCNDDYEDWCINELNDECTHSQLWCLIESIHVHTRKVHIDEVGTTCVGGNIKSHHHPTLVKFFIYFKNSLPSACRLDNGTGFQAQYFAKHEETVHYVEQASM